MPEGNKKNNTLFLGLLLILVHLVLGVLEKHFQFDLNSLKSTIQEKFILNKTGLSRKYYFAGAPQAEVYPNKLKLLENKAFLVAYDQERNNPAWVSYRAFRVPKSKKAPKRPRRFKVDHRTKNQINHKDYSNSGYDRGHLAPNYLIATRYGREAQLETFLMTNIVPQKPSLNQVIWRELEEKIAQEYADQFLELWIITGPVYYQADPDRFLESGVEIPDAFFKIIIDLEEKDHNQPRILGFLIEQDDSYDPTFKSYLISIDQLENLTGFDFFSELENQLEETLESKSPRSIW